MASGELAAAEPQRIFEPDTDIAAHDRAHRYQRHLVAPGGNPIGYRRDRLDKRRIFDRRRNGIPRPP
jgi:hypothetical protein